MAISTAHADRAEASYGLATLNISSGRFVFSEVSGSDALLTEIERTKPAEVLVADDAQALHQLVRTLPFDSAQSGNLMRRMPNDC